SARSAVAAVAGMSDVMGLLQLMDLDGPQDADGAEHRALDSLVQDLLVQRAAAREAKDWALADTIRDRLAAAGVVVQDGPQGAEWSVCS
ncbi:cysteine--tRNA ligase, partial [Kocuria sp. HSID17582]